MARWSDGEWRPLADGSSLPVLDLAALKGAIYAVGGFGTSDIARWTGIGWDPLDFDATDGAILALAALEDGRMFVAGDFTEFQEADGIKSQANRIAFFDGDVWQPLPDGGVNRGRVHALSVQNGDVILGGEFATLGGDETAAAPPAVSSNVAVYHNASRVGVEIVPERLESTGQISVYPSPAAESVYVSFPESLFGPIRVTVYDMLGREVYRSAKTHFAAEDESLRIPTEGLAAGVYLLVLTQKSQSTTSTIVVADN